MNKKLRKKANSLIEVLVVLGIISSTMLVSVNVIIQNVAQLRVNELEDAANGVMIQGLEIAKSPADVVTNSELLPDKETVANSSIPLFFTLDRSGNQNILNEIVNGSVITECNDGSPYLVEIESDNENLNGFNTCLQIEIEAGENSASGEYYYLIKSRVIYQVPGDVNANTVAGYRFEEFISQ